MSKMLNSVLSHLSADEKEKLDKMSKEYKRGEIYYISIEPVVGNEQMSGRPAVIVSANALNKENGTVEIVYLTTQEKKRLPTHVQIISSRRQSTVLCEQITTVSKTRIGDYFGTVTKEEMQAIDEALKHSLALRDSEATEQLAVSRLFVQEKDNQLEKLKAELKEKDNEVALYKRMYEELLNKILSR